ncbi:hypothetical protein LTR62_007771 [Meristemomyces frigidus]|uniref:Uncharacterized protein n=1 Tax=Meristemomyces frigidus TaxID=1508187 RepID=A0AAN7TBM8_9PEZI|nr:hypothetical protein LTR62_007771 [Meristemomyces frigidus]
MGRFSSVAPATLRIQVLPVGRVARERFTQILKALGQNASVLSLADVDGDEEQGILSPRHYPGGSLLCAYDASPASEQELQFSPFELFREPHIVLGIADGLSKEQEQHEKELVEAVEHLREHNPRVIHRHVLVLPSAGGSGATALDNVTRVAKAGEDEGGLALKDAMSEVAGSFLTNFAIYAKATRASPAIATPGQTVRGSQRIRSLLSDDGRPLSINSGSVTPSEFEVTSPVGGNDSAARSPPRNIRSPPPPPTSFDIMPGANNLPTALARSDSQSKRDPTARADSQDRAATTTLSRRQIVDRGKARVGIVLGQIHLMAGQWPEALRILSEHTVTSRKLSDAAWYGKGLECIAVVMLLMTWAGQQFMMPALCSPQAAQSSLASVLSELLKTVLLQYATAEVDGLPFLIVAEARIRFCNILSQFRSSDGEPKQSCLEAIVHDTPSCNERHTTGVGVVGGIAKIGIVETIMAARPLGEHNLPFAVQICLLTGIYGTLATLGMNRRKGLILREITEKLTDALNQARKLGAAEAGIHPATSLSTDAGAAAIASSLSEGTGMTEILETLAEVYGINGLEAAGHADRNDEDNHQTSSTTGYKAFHNMQKCGNNVLKLELLKTIAAFCEASPDLQGVVNSTASLLQAATPAGAVSTEPDQASIALSKDEQANLAVRLVRTVAVAKQLGLPDIKAHYWDKFLARGLVFKARDSAHTLLPYATPGTTRPAGTSKENENPYLYDPNASRNATVIREQNILVINEPQECLVALQNTLDISLVIESVVLVAGGPDDVELRTLDFRSVTLGPTCFQAVALTVLPSRTGSFAVVGCRIKIAGCQEQNFAFHEQPSTLVFQPHVKLQGQSSFHDHSVESEIGPKPATYSCTAIPPVPMLIAEMPVKDRFLTLLDGEKQFVTLHLRNTFDVAATIVSIHEDNGMVKCHPGLVDGCSITSEQDDGRAVDKDGDIYRIPPGGKVAIRCAVYGKSGILAIQLVITYRSTAIEDGPQTYWRTLSLPFEVTTEPALEVIAPIVEDLDSETFSLSFGILNRHTRALTVLCKALLPLEHDAKHDFVSHCLLMPGHDEQVTLNLDRNSLLGDTRAVESPDSIREKLKQIVRIQWEEEKTDGTKRVGQTHLTSSNLTRDHLNIISGAVFRLSSRCAFKNPSSLDLNSTSLKLGHTLSIFLTVSNFTTSTSSAVLVKLELAEGLDPTCVLFHGALSQLVRPLEPGEQEDVGWIVEPLVAGEVLLRGWCGAYTGRDERWESRTVVGFPVVGDDDMA